MRQRTPVNRDTHTLPSQCAGDKEHHEPFTRNQPPYSAFRSDTYGYSKLTIHNSTHLLWEQRQTDNECEWCPARQPAGHPRRLRLTPGSPRCAPADPKTTGTVIDAMLLISPTHGSFLV